MDRWACVDAFRFPLQVLLSRHPEWTDEPVAVVDRDGPRGRLSYLNRRARTAGLDRQMTFGEATTLVPRLRTETIEASLLEERSVEMAGVLDDFSPRVECDEDHPGLLWLEVSGLETLYDGWDDWISPLKECLRTECDLYVAVVVGFSRFGTFAVARATGESGLFESPDSERRAARSVPLDALDIGDSMLETTRRLDITTIGDLLNLPAEGLRRRLGDRAYRWYRRARGDLEQPRSTVRPDDETSRTDRLDRAESNRDRLLFLVKRHLHELIDDLDTARDRVAALELTLHRARGDPVETEIRPAEPTRETGLLADLIRLRLETLPIDSGVTDLEVRARGERTDTEQLHLFAPDNNRDIEAANRALARLRAEFGPDAVLRIEPQAGHLPESRFELRRLDELELPEVEASRGRPAIRRFFPAPMHLPDRLDASVCAGPHVVSGGWWVRRVRRDYHFVETGDRLLWIFYDHRRHHWYVHGEY